MVVISVYRSGLGDFEAFLQILEDMLARLISQFPPDVDFTICGDFNVQFTAKTRRTQDLMNLMRMFNLHQTIFHATRNNKKQRKF